MSPCVGAISAILMAKSLVYFLESDLCLDSRSPLGEEDARQFLIRREILRAVAAHTCPDIYHLEFDSLAFLLWHVTKAEDFWVNDVIRRGSTVYETKGWRERLSNQWRKWEVSHSRWY